MASIRFLVGGIVILGWAWVTGRLEGLRIARAERWPLLVLGLMLTAQIATMNIATSLTSAAHVAIILNLYAVHFVVLAHFLIPGDRLSLRRLTGVLIAYSGIVLVFGGQAAGGSTLLGDGLVFFSGLLLAERTVYMARAVQTFDPVKILLAQAVIGGLLLWLLSALFEPVAAHWTRRLAGSIAFQGLIVAGFNFIVNLWLLKRYRPTALAAFFLTQPLFGVVAAALFAGDALTFELLIASAAVAAGIGLTAR